MNFYNNNETIKTYENAGTTHGNNYNWGYDPHSYFSPEGWYSTDPENPYSRISELKTLINEAHKLGLRVILDVVYNHMAKTDFLDDIVPNYYFRQVKDGSFTSNSGCGNDVASEHAMTRKLIVDSLVYWTKEYHVDGFRFDLMGLLDAETVMTGYEKCAEIKKDVLFIGEGWKMYNGEKGTVGMDQNYMKKTEKVAVFNDEFRDLAKAGGMSEAGQGFLTGKKISVPDLFCNCCGKPVHNYSVTKPSSNVQYFACHDGLTLHDSIVNNMSIDESTEEGKIEAVNRLKLANALLLTSQGIAFLHAGQERGRTKPAFTTAGTSDCETIGNFVKNSYDSSDNINNFIWNLSDLNKDLFEYTKNLIALRKNNSVFTISTQDEVMSRISLLGEYCEDFFMAYKILDEKGDWYLFFNSDGEDKNIDLNLEGKKILYADKEKVYPLGSDCCLQDVVVKGGSVLILRNVK
jgi:pullulanase/glycogen debranching enzyme